MPRFRIAFCMAALFAVNAYICGGLFSAEITRQTGSIEGAFISFSRWLADHWGESGWFPLWVTGTPVRQVYQPVLHFSVAELARLTQWTPQHAYHFLTALTYSLGPVALFWLCYRATRRVGFALLTGTLYSVVSPACFLIPAVRQDAGGLLLARRFQSLVQYGEGPHVTALMLLPLVIWLLDEAASARRRAFLPWAFLPWACFALATLALTNWTGTMGLSMAVAAYALSKLGATKADGPPLHWPTLLGIAAIAYLFTSPWLPPSLIRTVLESSSNMETAMPVSGKLLFLLALGCAIGASHFFFQRFRVNRWFRFFLYFALISGAIAGGDLWFGWRIFPLAQRFHLEMEMAIVGAVAYAALHTTARPSRWGRTVALCLLVVFCAAQVRNYHRYAQELAQEVDFTATVEYKMAQWFAANMEGQRVFSPGSVSYWMNLYSDVPQFLGCCEQSIRSRAHRVASYFIYSGSGGASARDGELAALWLKVYGVAAVGVAASGSSQSPQPFRDPKKFDGILPEAWREGESVIYRVPQRRNSLAHVIARSAVVSREPLDGLDIEPLRPLLAALDDLASPPATLRWLSPNEAEVTVQIAPGQVIFIQQTYDPGWHAIEKGRDLKIVPDALGLTIMDPGAVPERGGELRFRLVYSGGLEDRLARAARVFAVVLLILWTMLAKRGSEGRV
ncbi:MAG: hypothetical protein HY648_10795 [Acidobacteria bacterium]|nr:hypothetical protein [Acidobacteriota bacterium]